MVVHCKRSAYDVYVGRGEGERGRWGNPFSHLPGTLAEFQVETREEAVERHRVWLWDQIRMGKILLEDLAELAGKVLGCWCAPRSCHAETLVRASSWAVRALDGELAFDRETSRPPF